MRSSLGLTLLETIVALAVVSIVLGSLATVSTSSLRESRAGNNKTQATQILDTVGRRIAGGEEAGLLPAEGKELELSSTALESLTNMDLADAAEYEVTIENVGDLTVSMSQLAQYRVTVCYAGSEGERCVVGATLGR